MYKNSSSSEAYGTLVWQLLALCIQGTHENCLQGVCWHPNTQAWVQRQTVRSTTLAMFLLVTCAATIVVARFVTLFWVSNHLHTQSDHVQFHETEVRTANLGSRLKYPGFVFIKVFNTLIPTALQTAPKSVATKNFTDAACLVHHLLCFELQIFIVLWYVAFWMCNLSSTSTLLSHTYFKTMFAG